MKHAQSTRSYDVIVVGGGNAALCAAIAAADEGSRVLLLERAPQSERGGNSIFTDGKFRAVYNGLEDVRALVPDLTEAEIGTDFGAYPEGDFFDDMARLTQYRTDPDLCEILVRNSRDIMFSAARPRLHRPASLGDDHVKAVMNVAPPVRGCHAPLSESPVGPHQDDFLPELIHLIKRCILNRASATVPRHHGRPGQEKAAPCLGTRLERATRGAVFANDTATRTVSIAALPIGECLADPTLDPALLSGGGRYLRRSCSS